MRSGDSPKVTISGRTRPAGSVLFLLCHFQGPHQGGVGLGAGLLHAEFHPAGSQSQTDFCATWQFMPPKAEAGFTQHNQGAGGLGPDPISALTHCFYGCCWWPTHLPSALTIFLGVSLAFSRRCLHLCLKALCGRWTLLCPCSWEAKRTGNLTFPGAATDLR